MAKKSTVTAVNSVCVISPEILQITHPRQDLDLLHHHKSCPLQRGRFQTFS